MTATAFEAPPIQPPTGALDPSNLPYTGAGQSGVDVLDPIHLPVTGTGYSYGGRWSGNTKAYSHTVAGVMPVQKPGEGKFYEVVAGEFPGEDQPNYVERTARPQWHEFVGSSATVTVTEVAAEPTAISEQPVIGRHRLPEASEAHATVPETQAEAPRARLFARARRAIANLAVRFTRRTNAAENVTEEAAPQSAPHHAYASHNARGGNLDLGLTLFDESAYYVEAPAPEAVVVATAKVTYENVTAKFSGRASVAEVAAPLPPRGQFVGRATVEPVPPQPVVPDVKAPGTDIMLHPTRNKEAALFSSTAVEALEEGLRRVDFASLDEYKAAVRNATNPEEVDRLQKALYRVTRLVSGPWKTAADLGDAGATAKLSELSALIDTVAKDLGIRRTQQSDEAKWAEQAGQKVGVTAADAAMINFRRQWQRR